MAESTNSQAASLDPQTQLQAINLETAAAQLRKLNLEIDDLESRKRLPAESETAAKSWWDEPLARLVPILVPIITAGISIIGFLWGVHIYNQQQERDRVTREAERISREQSQLRTDYNNLLEISSNEKVTVARVLALRQNVDVLIDSLYPASPDEEQNRKNQDENKRKKDEVRKSIYVLFSRDFDFAQPKHAQFDMAALQEWTDYKKGLQDSDPIIGKYFQSLAAYRRLHPGFFENIKLTDDGEPQELDRIVGDPVKSMFEGFACHRDLLLEEKKDKVMSNLTKVIGSGSLSAELRDFPCPKIEGLPKLPSN